MYDLIIEWLSEDMTELLGSYVQPVAAALVVGLGLCGCLFMYSLLVQLVNSAFGGKD